MKPLLKYFPVIKIDDQTHTVWGIVTSETPDSDKEICDYSFAKAAIQKWSDETLAKTTAAGQDPSLGNMRVMHQLQIGGKAIKIEYRDAEKQIWVGSEPANEEVWHLLKGGFLTAHSIGGSYAWTKPEGAYERYGPTINEISYVDRGANPDATFAYVKADGTTELRKFAKPGPEEEKILQKMKAASLANLSDEDIARIAKSVAESLAKGIKYLVPGTTHLPYTDESGKPSHSHMGAAWAALHGGYRGNKYEGPGKEQAIAHLKEIYHSEGMEPPSEKAAGLIDELSKALEFCGDSDLDTDLAKLSAQLTELMGKLSAQGENMNPEQIKKCATALGITESEFQAQYLDEGKPLAKAHSMAALHAHMEAMQTHHEAMHKAHGQMGTMHEKMATHIGKCMKACKGLMGTEDEADKAIKALLDEMTKTVETPEAKVAREAAEKAASGTLTKADVDKAIADAVAKAIGELPERQTLRIIPRDSSELIKSADARDAALQATSPF